MFRPIKNQTISEKVIEQIKLMLVEGQLQKGEKLPSERQMAETLMISRSSVREALKELEIMGLIEVKPGDGNFIKTNFEDILYEPFATMFLIKESNADEILELRKIIEKGTASLAAERISPEELKDIREILDTAMESNDENQLTDLDILFHYKIAQASKNFLLQSILNTISTLIEHFISDVRKNILIEDKHKRNIISQHENIYQALRDHNSLEAERAMTIHLNYVNSEMENQYKR